MRLLAAPDKLAGTLSATHAAEAIALGARAAGWEVTLAPLSDGGEGFGEVLGGVPVHTVVTGPLGEMVPCLWRRSDDGSRGVIEMADAAGRSLLPHPIGTQTVDATTRGVGELILQARDAGCTRVIVGCGGSATTDGGRGCVEAILDGGGLGGITDLVVATDVTTRFVDAATMFAPQKGASPAQVDVLTERLRDDARWLSSIDGISITTIERGGAAGGLAGGLAALGGTLVSGFDLVASSLGLADTLSACALVVTGEGRIDKSTLQGKTIDSLLAVTPSSMPVLIVAGAVDAAAAAQLGARRTGPLSVHSLVEEIGEDRALHDTAAALSEVVLRALEGSLPHQR